MSARQSPRRRLFVHVGLQKTGTSYLQGVMLRNRDVLAAQGLDLVPATKRESFHLMLDVRNRYTPGRDPESVAMSLERFEADLAAAPGLRALYSQESLAACRPGQVERFLAACGDREVHVVATVRDLSRQLPSSWQQELKAGRDVSYDAYLDRLREQQREGSGSHPWIHLDPPAVLARWAAFLPPEQVHVVTVPPPGSPVTLLMERFCRVLEVDPARLEPEEKAGNTSLGRVQAEVLRRVNQQLPEELRRRNAYGDVGKRFFAVSVLGQQEGRSFGVPRAYGGWCEEVAAGQVDALSGAGYRVEGSLDDLRCPAGAFADAGGPAEEEVSAAAVTALAAILRSRMEEPTRARVAAPATGSGARAREWARRVKRAVRERLPA